MGGRWIRSPASSGTVHGSQPLAHDFFATWALMLHSGAPLGSQLLARHFGATWALILYCGTTLGYELFAHIFGATWALRPDFGSVVFTSGHHSCQQQGGRWIVPPPATVQCVGHSFSATWALMLLFNLRLLHLGTSWEQLAIVFGLPYSMVALCLRCYGHQHRSTPLWRLVFQSPRASPWPAPGLTARVNGAASSGGRLRRPSWEVHVRFEHARNMCIYIYIFIT